MTLHAAHVVTSEATAMGDPEIIIMTRDEGMGAKVVVGYDVDVAAVDHGSALLERGWRPVGSWAEVATGYWVVDVERL